MVFPVHYNYASCISCSAKVSEKSTSSTIGICRKCGIKQKLARCRKNTAARVVIKESIQEGDKDCLYVW